MEDKFALNWSGAIKGGVFIGLVMIAFSVIQYVFNMMTINIYMSSVIGVISLVLLFATLWIFGNQYKKNHVTGLFSWGNAFTTLLIMSFASAVLSSLYGYIFNAFIDPEYMTKTMEELRYMSEEFYLKMGMEEEQIQKQLERFDAARNQTPMKQLTNGILFGTIGGGVISLIVAAIIRKKNPVFE